MPPPPLDGRPGRSDAERSGVERHVLGDGHVVIQAQPLRDVPQAASRPTRRRVAEHGDPTGGGGEQAEQHADQRGLARTVRAQEADDLAGADLDDTRRRRP